MRKPYWLLLLCCKKVHDAGLLSLMSGLISAGNTIIDHLAAVADAPQAVTGLRAILILGSVLNTLDADELEKAMKVDGENAPILHIIRGLTTKEARTAASVGVKLLNVFGKALVKQGGGPP
jgi:hypothetical protein